MRDPVAIAIRDASAVGESRRVATALAAALGLSEDTQGRLALVATEAATNLLKHAKGGEIVLRTLAAPEGRGVEVLALDRGPGIADIARCMRDGFSTAGTGGSGLGAINRQSELFDLASTPGAGTVVVARVQERKAQVPVPTHVQIGVVCLPVPGEQENGDGWATETSEQRTAVLVVDGLGHGLLAATAAREAVRVFREQASAEPAEIIHALDRALRPTRGAAAAVAVVDRASRTLRFAGVGNIAAAVLALDRRQGLVSLNGTLGHAVRKVQVFEYSWPAGAVLLLHSDGLATQWDLGRYPGLAARHPALIAGTLYRDGRRERDDVTVLVMRDVSEGGTP